MVDGLLEFSKDIARTFDFGGTDKPRAEKEIICQLQKPMQ
jgi:hypothetical protein